MTANTTDSIQSGSSTFANPEFWEFVNDHRNDDTTKLRLKVKESDNRGFDVMAAILQIDARRRFGKKLSATLESFDRFYFPDLLAGEQSTGDRAATFHERLINPGDSLVDMTSGLGIDVMHLAKIASTVTAVERKPALTAALEWNSRGLGLENITIVNGDATGMLDSLPDADTVFIDPARRSADGGRVFGLSDCEPDVVALMPGLKAKFGRLVLKASPMLDITRTIADIEGTTDVYIIGSPTECKELDVVARLDGEVAEPVAVHAVTLSTDGSEAEMIFTREEEASAPVVQLGLPTAGGYLYEPSPAVMKAAPFKLLASRFNVKKLSNNTHIYLSSELRDFPGEAFRIVEVVEWQSKHIKRFKQRYPKISVTTRNFGMTADALRAKLGVKDGGRERLFAVTAADDRRLMIVAEPVVRTES